jgi:hypothetical protein
MQEEPAPIYSISNLITKADARNTVSSSLPCPDADLEAFTTVIGRLDLARNARKVGHPCVQLYLGASNWLHLVVHYLGLSQGVSHCIVTGF